MATTTLKILRVIVILSWAISPNNRLIKKGKPVIPKIALSEMYRVMAKLTRKMEKQINTAPGWMAHNTPVRVATPLPPLKRKKTGKICPATEASPKIIWAAT